MFLKKSPRKGCFSLLLTNLGGSGGFVEVKGVKLETGAMFVLPAEMARRFYNFVCRLGRYTLFYIMINRYIYNDMLTQR